MNRKGFANIILVVVVVILVGVVGYFVFVKKSEPTAQQQTPTPASKDETADWKTYTNPKYSYSVKYPSTWAYREFPSTVAGAAFRLSTKASDPANEFISIGYTGRATQNANLPLDQYLKREGADIETFGDIVTIDKVTTDSGIVGYKVTWEATSRDGKTTSTSHPFTYFPTADGKTIGMIVVSSGSTPYLADYGKMIGTFKYTN